MYQEGGADRFSDGQVWGKKGKSEMPWAPVVRKNGLSFTERRRHWDRILKLSSLRTTDYRPCLLLLLLLSRFSCVWLCATPQTAAHQASLSLEFSRKEHWSGLPFLSPMHESEKWKWKVKSKSESEVAQSCPTLCDPNGLQPTRLLCPWDFPGKSTGVGCHCLVWQAMPSSM